MNTSYRHEVPDIKEQYPIVRHIAIEVTLVTLFRCIPSILAQVSGTMLSAVNRSLYNV